MTERQQQILKAIIQKYINTAQAVSSEAVVSHYGLNISPATARNEMKELEEKGYLYQPHTSAGRIPTEKAYHFYIKNLQEINRNLAGRKRRKNLTEIISSLEDKNLSGVLREITHFLAEESENLAFGGIKELREFHCAGLSNLLKEPEFRDTEILTSVVRLVEQVDRYMERVFSAIPFQETRIFIGKQNPLAKFKQTSLIVTACRLPRKKHGLLAILGPTRMRYELNVSLLNQVKDYIEELW